jgi:hypothetical protein
MNYYIFDVSIESLLFKPGVAILSDKWANFNGKKVQRAKIWFKGNLAFLALLKLTYVNKFSV